MTLVTIMQQTANGLGYLLNLTSEPASNLLIGLGVAGAIGVIIVAIASRIKNALE